MQRQRSLYAVLRGCEGLCSCVYLLATCKAHTTSCLLHPHVFVVLGPVHTRPVQHLCCRVRVNCAARCASVSPKLPAVITHNHNTGAIAEAAPLRPMPVPRVCAHTAVCARSCRYDCDVARMPPLLVRLGCVHPQWAALFAMWLVGRSDGCRHARAWQADIIPSVLKQRREWMCPGMGCAAALQPLLQPGLQHRMLSR